MPTPQFVWYHEDVRVYPDCTVSPGGYWADTAFDDGRGMRLDGWIVGEYDDAIRLITTVIGRINFPDPRSSEFVLAGGYGFEVTHKGISKELYIVCFRPDDTRIKNGCRYEVSFHHK